jgi:TRAP-type C4-dicarboxylate transport system substrate-binding protein
MAAQTGVVDGFEHDAGTVLASKFNEVVKSCWLTEHLFAPMVVVMGRRSQDRIPAALRPAFMKAVADATTQQRAIANDKAVAATEELKRKGMTFFPMAAADRNAVRAEMQAKLWADFSRQYPSTAPLFAAIASARV